MSVVNSYPATADSVLVSVLNSVDLPRVDLGSFICLSYLKTGWLYDGH